MGNISRGSVYRADIIIPDMEFRLFVLILPDILVPGQLCAAIPTVHKPFQDIFGILDMVKPLFLFPILFVCLPVHFAYV